MNKDRRKAIAEIASQMGNADGLSDLDGLADAIEALRDEEQEYLDNMPESLQYSERGETAQNAIQYLDDAANAVREMKDKFDEALQALEEAQS